MKCVCWIKRLTLNKETVLIVDLFTVKCFLVWAILKEDIFFLFPARFPTVFFHPRLPGRLGTTFGTWAIIGWWFPKATIDQSELAVVPKRSQNLVHEVGAQSPRNFRSSNRTHLGRALIDENQRHNLERIKISNVWEWKTNFGGRTRRKYAVLAQVSQAHYVSVVLWNSVKI